MNSIREEIMEENTTDSNKFWMLEKGGTANNLRVEEIRGYRWIYQQKKKIQPEEPWKVLKSITYLWRQRQSLGQKIGLNETQLKTYGFPSHTARILFLDPGKQEVFSLHKVNKTNSGILDTEGDNNNTRNWKPENWINEMTAWWTSPCTLPCQQPD